ncbi:S8 family peptidase [Sphingobacterium corticibacter]|uniref:Peptidase S8 n=1 Tax=Sphingobacterium corticibacter TaxID=2171749 RepID=A0A2T8HH61_9SPHI|nr:S8 family peptidase [Sphingobacterium corticibacter]PVH24778.1 peptidase S8 [Sphingobacterium corticibacter]
MNRINKALLYLALGIFPYASIAQDKDTPPPNWYNLDFQKDGIMGISTEKAYDFLKNKTAKPVVVAVLDGGVDIQHEDLKEVLWKNPKETAGSTKDNDGNGYAGDVYGWNFLGNANGENVNQDNLEVTRLIRKYEPKYISVLPSTRLSETERREFVAYQQMIGDYTSKMDEAQFGATNYSRLKEDIDGIVASTGKEPKDITKADLDKITPSNDRQKMAIRIIKKELDKDPFDKFYDSLTEGVKYYEEQVNFHLNKDFNPRSIIGDNYDDASERYYGNPDVKGPDAGHGTHVAGIIGAKRGNNIGIDGVANHVEIMAVRTVPNGDEHDKDVANAIRYAVDNGAKIINMSFGKSYVYNKQTVDDAVKYAESKDVLLVHAAGNDGADVDVTKNYPMKYYTDSLGSVQGEAKNWITVGATGWKQDADLVATFSNYGYRSVDVFAPGVRINSTMPESTYKEQQGTSMAAPVVAGLAAILRSYYPDLTAPEVKDIILKSVTKVDQKVKVPGEGRSKKAYLDEISVSGGIVNAYEAVKLADELASKR